MPVVPDTSALSPSDAFGVLQRAGLRPVILGLPTMKSDGLMAHRVVAQVPAAGEEVEEGTRVALAFETHLLGWGLIDPPRAPPGSPAPAVLELNVDQAARRITDAHLVAVVFQPRRAMESLAVSKQEPTAGAPVGPFREVALWLDET